MQGFIRKPITISILIIVFLIFLNSQGWLGMFKNLTLETSGQAQEKIYSVFNQTKEFVNGLFSLPEILQENQRLRQNNLALLSELALLNQAAQENAFLRKHFQVEEDSNQKYFLAEVIGQNLTEFDQTILINKGQRQGIEKGQVAVSAGNVLIGQIIEVYFNYSKVRLITDSNSQINALIQENQVSGVAIGQGDNEILFDLLPQGENIQPEQLVLSSGAANLLPKGLLIGRVKKVISLDAQISQRAIIQPSFLLSDLNKVLIIK